MKDGPSIALIAALAGDPARANMLTALMGGKALTASELANEAGVTVQTASSHLAKLENGGLIGGVRQGRHRYFKLANSDVAQMLETMMGVAARAGHLRTRPGPRDAAMRKARVCYDHLAGEMGVALFDALVAAGHLAVKGDAARITPKGETFFAAHGIDVVLLAKGRRTFCTTCLDWSQRRFHLAGALGAALLNVFTQSGWARRERNGRALHFTPEGERRFRKLFAAA
jgi:DNA-binding transcriptional ArsR family regulator